MSLHATNEAQREERLRNHPLHQLRARPARRSGDSFNPVTMLLVYARLQLPHGQNGQWTRAQVAVHSRCGTPAKICCWRVLSGCQRIGSIELEFHLLSLHRGSPSAEWK
ncbi:hypothetical protein PI125_g25816 [Phytophthora idaei]|nr:hypothetical protein PI125_g25816 [Phytophthora idaei]KAG3123584.1 hypothetical protein PI126_g23637 [Phytophthora idaei]